MFRASKRLSREDFPKALASRKRFSGVHLSIVVPEGVQGYAVVVSKKVAKLSVARHKIKRRVLAAMRALRLPPALLVFPRSSASSVSYKDIQIELKQLLSKIHTHT